MATLRVMAASGEFDPDLGYWAEELDPSGSLHPIAFTTETSTGRWINVTTLPALWVGWGLYSAGGYRAALLVPMLGSVAAAFAALALLRRLGVPSSGRAGRWGWAGFWLVGLASPLTVYALDFWEHSVGVALMAWAVVLLCDAGGRRASWWWRVGAAGLLLGTAATMRTEALVYLAAAGTTWAVLRVRSVKVLPGTARADAHRTGAVVSAGAGLAVLLAGAAVPLAVNEAVERRVVGTTIRAARVAGTALGIGADPGSRLEEAAITLVGLEGSDLGIVLGAASAVLLLFAATRTDRGLAIAATAGAAALFAVRALAGGLGFIPGLVAAWVLPAAALTGFVNAQAGMPASAFTKARAARGLVLGTAFLAIPVVLATQFRGGAAPQWAGRYLLTSGLLLAVAGWAALAHANRTRLAAATAALAAAVTVFGLAWTSVRTHDVARTIAALEARPEEVIVSDVYHLAREGGATYGDRRWLTLSSTDREDAAVDVLTGAGVETFASVQATGARDPLRFDGYRSTAREQLTLFAGVDLTVTSWQKIPETTP